MVDEKYRQFLIEHLRVDKVRHSGRDFYTHLQGTHDLLQKWGNREAICAAGLFHSIYGTQIFRHSAWPIARRDTIGDLIGPEAELLAYIFCVTERPKVFLANIGATRIAMLDHHTNETLVLSGPQLRDLLEIEAANLLEQGGNNAGALLRLLASDISGAAKRELSLCLERRPAVRPAAQSR
jgi:hypothetical protein